MTHKVLIDGKEYVLNTQAEHKEGDPINFPITKKDMEHHMWTITVIEDLLKEQEEKTPDFIFPDLALNRMKKAFQHMIDETEKRGNWK